MYKLVAAIIASMVIAESSKVSNSKFSSLLHNYPNVATRYRVFNTADEELDWTEARRIYSGHRSKIKRYPFMTSIHVDVEFMCAGSIISRHHVLTAASCLRLAYGGKTPARIFVRVGSSFTLKSNDMLEVSEMNFHPKFDHVKLIHNLALAGVRESFVGMANKNVKRVEFVTNPKLIAATVTVLGWGDQKKNVVYRGPLSKIRLKIYNFEDCKKIYSKTHFLSEDNFCAVSRGTKGGACNKDAGGPAIVGSKLVGVISFAPKMCGTDTPTVFTHVRGYTEWIHSVTQQTQNSAETRAKLKQKNSQPPAEKYFIPNRYDDGNFTLDEVLESVRDQHPERYEFTILDSETRHVRTRATSNYNETNTTIKTPALTTLTIQPAHNLKSAKEKRTKQLKSQTPKKKDRYRDVDANHTSEGNRDALRHRDSKSNRFKKTKSRIPHNTKPTNNKADKTTIQYALTKMTPRPVNKSESWIHGITGLGKINSSEVFVVAGHVRLDDILGSEIDTTTDHHTLLESDYYFDVTTIRSSQSNDNETEKGNIFDADPLPSGWEFGRLNASINASVNSYEIETKIFHSVETEDTTDWQLGDRLNGSVHEIDSKKKLETQDTTIGISLDDKYTAKSDEMYEFTTPEEYHPYIILNMTDNDDHRGFSTIETEGDIETTTLMTTDILNTPDHYEPPVPLRTTKNKVHDSQENTTQKKTINVTGQPNNKVNHRYKVIAVRADFKASDVQHDVRETFDWEKYLMRMNNITITEAETDGLRREDAEDRAKWKRMGRKADWQRPG